MTNNMRNPDQIERDIEDERAELSGSIKDLQEKFSVDSIVRDVGDMFRGQNGDLGGVFGQSIKDTVGRNPRATALTAVGLAWMFLGPFGAKSQGRDTPQRAYGHKDAVRSGQRTATHQHDDDVRWFGTYPDNGTSGRDARSAPQKSNQQSSGHGDIVRDGAESVAASISRAASDMRERAYDLKERLEHGTENLSDEARARVIAARQAAHDARLAAEEGMNRSGRAATDMFEDHPLVVGALAVALGAAIGSALPHSRMEDDTMGTSRDRLFDEAQTVFHEEREKAMAVLGAAANEAKEVIDERRADIADNMPDASSTAEAIKDRASDAVTRVVDEARREADTQGLTPSKP